MAGERWYKVGVGLQARDHSSRKYGRKFDRFFRGRYMIDGQWKVVPFGWESEWAAAEKARMEAEGTPVSRMSFLEHCTIELARLKSNAKIGQGPTTIKEDAAIRKAKAQENEQARKEEERQALTFKDFFKDQYIPTAKTHKKSETIAEEESIFKVWLKGNIGNIRLVDLSPIHVEKVKKAMLKEGRTPRRVEYALAVIRQTWNAARSRGFVTGDWPGKDVKLPTFDNQRQRFLTKKEAEDLLAEIKRRSEQTYNISVISLDCGLRFGEIVKLQWGHIDTDNMTIRVVDPKPIKGTKSRTAFMTERVKEMFETLPRGEKTELVFRDRWHGGPIKKISHAFWRSVDKLGLNDGIEDRRDKLVFHSLRHSFASNLIAGGADLYVVSKLLGHADVTMAARYSHLRADSLRQAIKNMEQVTAAQEPPTTKVLFLKKSENA